MDKAVLLAEKITPHHLVPKFTHHFATEFNEQCRIEICIAKFTTAHMILSVINCS